MNVVESMAGLVMIAHNGVNRKGPGNVPYIVHPHAVVAMLKRWGYNERDDIVTLSVAWGHDILEDTNMPESRIKAAIGDESLARKITAGIEMLTFRPDVPPSHPDYGRNKSEYIENVARTAPPEIIVVKIADRLCNTMDFGSDGYARLYYGYGEPLFRRIKDCAYADRIEANRREIEKALP